MWVYTLPDEGMREIVELEHGVRIKVSGNHIVALYGAEAEANAIPLVGISSEEDANSKLDVFAKEVKAFDCKTIFAQKKGWTVPAELKRL